MGPGLALSRPMLALEPPGPTDQSHNSHWEYLGRKNSDNILVTSLHMSLPSGGDPRDCLKPFKFPDQSFVSEILFLYHESSWDTLHL